MLFMSSTGCSSFNQEAVKSADMKDLKVYRKETGEEDGKKLDHQFGKKLP